jgi:hypothetical protein
MVRSPPPVDAPLFYVALPQKPGSVSGASGIDAFCRSTIWAGARLVVPRRLGPLIVPCGCGLERVFKVLWRLVDRRVIRRFALWLRDPPWTLSGKFR